MKCWAKSVSECCGTQSREHYVTKGLFSNKYLKVSNAPFLEANKVIPKNELTKKCLCKKHNEQLSPYDKEAIKFGQALEYARDLSLIRRTSKKKKFSLHKKDIVKERLSHWFLKTFFGVHEFLDTLPLWLYLY